MNAIVQIQFKEEARAANLTSRSDSIVRRAHPPAPAREPRTEGRAGGMSGAPPLPILPDQLRHSVKLGAALEQHHHELVISVHAVALVGCAASLCVGIERLCGRLAGGIDEFSPMTQSTDPGLLSNTIP